MTSKIEDQARAEAAATARTAQRLIRQTRFLLFLWVELTLFNCFLIGGNFIAGRWPALIVYLPLLLFCGWQIGRFWAWLKQIRRLLFICQRIQASDVRAKEYYREANAILESML